MSRGGGAQHKWVLLASGAQRCKRCGCERRKLPIKRGHLSYAWTYYHAGATSKLAGECMGGL